MILSIITCCELMSKPVGNVSTYYLFSAICKSNHLPWQNKICPNAMQFVCVRTPEHLAIAFHNGFFSSPLLFFCVGMGPNGELCRKGCIRCLAASKDLCNFTCYFQCDFDVSDSTDILSFGRQGAYTHTEIFRFHLSFNSLEMSHQPVTCCANSKQE